MKKIKLIIDIDEKRFRDIQRIASIQIRRRSLTCEQIIANGKPLQTEFEEIKAEIREWYWQADKQKISKDPCVVDAMIDLFIRTVDKHIAELKGE